MQDGLAEGSFPLAKVGLGKMPIGGQELPESEIGPVSVWID